MVENLSTNGGDAAHQQARLTGIEALQADVAADLISPDTSPERLDHIRRARLGEVPAHALLLPPPHTEEQAAEQLRQVQKAKEAARDGYRRGWLRDRGRTE